MIIIGADIVPTETNKDRFQRGDMKSIIGKELVDLLDHADYRIFNLEVPLTDTEAPIQKFGPNLIAPASCAAGLKEIHADLLTLANNHIMDQNEQGLVSTVHALNEAGISYVGVGKNIHEASKPFFFSVTGKRYGVYACAEQEFSIADEEHAGANPFDPLESLDHVAHMKAACDFAIVLYHGGKEHYRYPSPYLQKVCRKLIEKGADLVVCQHSHCIGCAEKYSGGTIVYGQGNFLFDLQNNEFWNTGLLIGITEDGRIEYYPIEKKGNGVALASSEKADMILREFEKRSAEAADGAILSEKYDVFAREMRNNYMINFSAIRTSFFYRVFAKLSPPSLQNRLLKKVAESYRKREGIAIRNFVECEAHRELLLKGLKLQ